MGRAQEIKRKLCPEQTKGKKMLPNKAIVNSDLVSIAKTIGLDASSGSLEIGASLDLLVSLEKERETSFSNDCPTCTRCGVLESDKEQDEIGQSQVVQAEGACSTSALEVVTSLCVNGCTSDEVLKQIVGRKNYRRRAK